MDIWRSPNHPGRTLRILVGLPWSTTTGTLGPEAPSTEQKSTQAPATQAPSSDQQTPSTEQQTPATQVPSTEQQTPSTKQNSTPSPATEQQPTHQSRSPKLRRLDRETANLSAFNSVDSGTFDLMDPGTINSVDPGPSTQWTQAPATQTPSTEQRSSLNFKNLNGGTGTIQPASNFPQ
ncbi:unnamed protein product [Phytophthora lilii]|uniref:Unnamed protein product n=1 Tax=Phytophthora lilii TaxID=2077276 RepID=A0A9W6YII8_9STRA|nr:unnamed protein product [Phytophthora lilii]